MRKISGHICESFYISLIDMGRYIPNSDVTISRRKWAEHNSIHHGLLTRRPCNQPAFYTYHWDFPINHHIFPVMVQWAPWTVRQNKTFSPKLLLVRYLVKAIKIKGNNNTEWRCLRLRPSPQWSHCPSFHCPQTPQLWCQHCGFEDQVPHCCHFLCVVTQPFPQSPLLIVTLKHLAHWVSVTCRFTSQPSDSVDTTPA